MSQISRRPAIAGLLATALFLSPDRAAATETSKQPVVQQEPEAARKLLALVEARRPPDWKPEERAEVDKLIDEVAKLKSPWTREDLRGKWKLVYLQPGPGGAGVDRRIPFPEFDFNDSFQIFGVDSVTNVGELLGSALEVRVSGSLSEDDLNDLTSPKRFRASINRGQICADSRGDQSRGLCLPLPISGEGLFDGIYLGRRLRIGQNLNGGGARIVQVRVDL